MPLSDEQMEKARQYFALNGVVPDCPYCSVHGWEGREIISATVVDEQGNAWFRRETPGPAQQLGSVAF